MKRRRETDEALMKKRKITARFTEHDRELLFATAEARDMSVSDLIRELLLGELPRTTAH